MIRKADLNDTFVLAKMAAAMWNNHTVDELTAEYTDLLKRENAAAFIIYENREPIGFAQCGLRCDYVEGTRTSPVGYLEGIYVKDSCRRKGYASRLLKECERWAKAKGCIEFASDCEADNEESKMFHVSSGFHIANKIICFAKKL